MNVTLTFIKEKKTSNTEQSEKIKQILGDYQEFVYLQHLKETMTEKDIMEMNEIEEMFDYDNIEQLQEIFGNAFNFEEKNENISELIKEAIVDFKEELDYFTGVKSTPLSKDLYDDASF